VSPGSNFIGGKTYLAVVVLSDAGSKFTLEGVEAGFGNGPWTNTKSPFSLKTGTAKSIQYYPTAVAGTPSIAAKTVLVEFAAIANQKITDGFIVFTQPADGGAKSGSLLITGDAVKFDTTNTGITWALVGDTTGGTWTNFAAGSKYTATIALKAEDGFIFDVAANTAGTLTPVFRILNLVPGAVVKYPKSSTNATSINITVEYPALEVVVPSGPPVVINAISITGLVVPFTTGSVSVATGSFSVTATPASGSPPTVTKTSATWKDDSGGTAGTDTTSFTAGSVYHLVIVLTAPATHAFTGLTGTSVTATAAPTSKTASVAGSDDETLTIDLVYTALTKITPGDIAVGGLTGASTLADITFTGGGTGVDTISRTWDGSNTDATSVPASGGDFTATLTIQATSGYTFGLPGTSGAFTASGDGSIVTDTGTISTDGLSVTGVTINIVN